jgi:hypothetical protein
MPEQEKSSDPATELDPRTRTRQEALTEALKAGTTPQPPREFSTLVERSESAAEASECADRRNCLTHGDEWGHGQLELAEDPGLNRVLDAINELAGPSPSATAGGAHRNRDEVQRQRDCESANATENERDDSCEDSKE